eukprot:939350-Prymnesium_polylepis.1
MPKRRRKPSAKPAKARRTADLTGRCYCGQIRFRVSATATVIRGAFCHCESCRRAHAAPLYQVCYVAPQDFVLTSGAALLKECRMVSAPSHGSRSFCSACGSRVCNIMADNRTGFFPATLDEDIQHALPEKFRPTLHHCPEEAVLPLPEDGLARQPNRYAAPG